MAKKTVKTEISTGKPDLMIDQAEKAVKKHLELGDASPLKNMDMSAFSTKVTLTKSKRAEARALRDQSEIKMQESDSALGIAKGQTSLTEGTVYNYLTIIRDKLLDAYRGNEEALNEWGFKVIIGESIPGRRKIVTEK